MGELEEIREQGEVMGGRPGRRREKGRAGKGRKRRATADRTIQSSQEATKGQQRADQIIQFIWIGERAGE